MALEQGYVDGERSTYWDLVVRPQFNLNRVSIIEVKRFNFVNPSSRLSCTDTDTTRTRTRGYGNF